MNVCDFTPRPCNEPGEKVKTFSSARLSEKSKDFLDNEHFLLYQLFFLIPVLN